MVFLEKKTLLTQLVRTVLHVRIQAIYFKFKTVKYGIQSFFKITRNNQKHLPVEKQLEKMIVYIQEWIDNASVI